MSELETQYGVVSAMDGHQRTLIITCTAVTIIITVNLNLALGQINSLSTIAAEILASKFLGDLRGSRRADVVKRRPMLIRISPSSHLVRREHKSYDRAHWLE